MCCDDKIIDENKNIADENKNIQLLEPNDVPDWNYIVNESDKMINDFMNSFGYKFYGGLGLSCLSLGAFLGWSIARRRLEMSKPIPPSAIYLGMKALAYGTILSEFRPKVESIVKPYISEPTEKFLLSKGLKKVIDNKTDINLTEQFEEIEGALEQVMKESNFKNELTSLFEPYNENENPLINETKANFNHEDVPDDFIDNDSNNYNNNNNNK